MLRHLVAGYVLLIVCILPTAQANTEIVNIHAVRSVATGHKPPSTWYVCIAFTSSHLTLFFVKQKACLVRFFQGTHDGARTGTARYSPPGNE